MSRRDEIRMTSEEVDDFLHERRTMSVATLGPDGHPHLVAMWYAFLDGAPAFWTYGKSQKIANLHRDPRITVLVEAGDVYEELRGVQLRGTAEIIEDADRVFTVGRGIYQRYQDDELTEEDEERIRRQSEKRVVVRIEAADVVSWDHRKL